MIEYRTGFPFILCLIYRHHSTEKQTVLSLFYKWRNSCSDNLTRVEEQTVQLQVLCFPGSEALIIPGVEKIKQGTMHESRMPGI